MSFTKEGFEEHSCKQGSFWFKSAELLSMAPEGGGRILEDPLILQHILSFLTTKEAAQTSLFSKAWLEAWCTRPTLEFDDEQHLFSFPNKKAADNLSHRACVRARKRFSRNFSGFIQTTMRRYSDRKSRINTLKLKITWRAIKKSVIRESIRIAFENKVRTLDLYLSGFVYGSYYVLGEKENVFGGNSIVNLNLRECQLRTLSVDQIRCQNIQRLDFYLVCFDELMFENIIHSCPLLKFLRIGRVGREDDDEEGFYDGPSVFRVKKHANLQQIDFELFTSQSLILGELPRLESLVCTNDENYLHDLQVQGDMSGDWMPCGFSLHSCQYQNINTLVLCAVGIGDVFFNTFSYMFPNVEDLCIQSCNNLRILKLLSRSIKRIGLIENPELKEAHFDVPRMVYFEFRSHVELAPALSFTAVSDGCVSFVEMRVGWVSSLVCLWFRKLKELLSGLCQSEISLSIMLPEIPEFNVDEIRNMFVSSMPVMVEKLSLCFSQKESTSTTLSIIDSIFWICRPRIMTFERSHDVVCMKLLYKILVLKRNPAQIRFWQMDLKDVQVGTFKTDVSQYLLGRTRQQRTFISFFSPRVFKFMEMGGNVLDWQGFLVASRTIARAGEGGIYFKFEWRGLQTESLNC